MGLYIFLINATKKERVEEAYDAWKGSGPSKESFMKICQKFGWDSQVDDIYESCTRCYCYAAKWDNNTERFEMSEDLTPEKMSDIRTDVNIKHDFEDTILYSWIPRHAARETGGTGGTVEPMEIN
jgi:hypothetical protein